MIQKVTISNTLYGRELEIESLGNHFSNICRGEGLIVFVPGRSGTGKTALVHTLQDPISQKNGWYVQGKFNQYQQGLPYFAFRQALAQIWDEITSASQIVLRGCLKNIQETIGDLTYLLVDLIPDLGKHLSVQAKPDGISPQEARHRFAHVIQSFLAIACKADHPVMMFIDDWQWADHASLDLLRQLDIGEGLRYFMLVASYRDDEIGHDHPLRPALADLKRKQIPIAELPIQNLDLDAIRLFIQGNLLPDVNDLDGFAETVFSITAGNPFYAKSFLEYANAFGFLRFDTEAESWILTIREDDTPSNIIDLFVRRLRRFERTTQRTLSLAACIGNRFDIETLGVVAQTESSEIESYLHRPIEAGMILSIPTRLRGNTAAGSRQFSFFHDRVQQAAFQLIDADDIKDTRLNIGRMMQANLRADRKDEMLFEIAGHLNHGADLIRDDGEMLDLIRLNVSAAQRARAATAYSAMLLHYRQAVEFARRLTGGMEAFSTSYHQLATEILQGWGESEFLEGDPATGEAAILEAVSLADTAVDRAEILNILIVNYTLLARYEDAISTGRKALAALGIELPEEDFEVARDRAIAEVRTALGERKILSLADSPVMTDPAMKTATKLLITMGPPCYRTHQRLWSVMVPLVVRITIEYGLIPQVGYSHTAFGGLLAWVENNYRDAKAFGEVAIRVMAEKFETPSYQSVFYLMVGSSTRHWFHHLRDSSEDYQKTYEIGLRSGNLQYAAYGFGHDMYSCFFRGVALDDLLTQSRQSLLFSKSRMNVWAIDLLEGGMRLFTIMHQSADPVQALADDADYREKIEEHHNIQVQCIYQILKAQCFLLLGEHDTSLELSRSTDKLLYTVGTQGLLPWPEHRFTRFLLLTATYPKADPAKQEAMREEMAAIKDQIALWVEWAPQNYRHKSLLACAEYSAIFTPSWDTVRLYSEAIAEAVCNEFVHWAGYANERASSFLQLQGLGALAHTYQLESYRCYDEWGGQAKLTLIEQQYQGMVTGYSSLLPHPVSGIEDQVCSQHVEMLRAYARNARLSKQEEERTGVFDELARATERLRVEVLEHKRTEDKLRESQRLLVATQEIGKIGGWALNLDTMRLSWTQETFAIHELESTHEPDVEGGISYYASDSQTLIRNAVHALIENREPFNLELQIKTAAGQIRDVHVIGHFDPHSNSIYGVIQDITVRVTMERQLQQSEKMRAIGQLAGGIAHDFNNQLSGILGYADMLTRRLDDPVLKRYCDSILVGAQRSADLTKQLLAFSRKGQYTNASTNLHALIAEVITMLSHSMDKRISFSQTLKASPSTVMGDASQIQNAILNLALNAQDAMPEGGTIDFRTTIVDGHSVCNEGRHTTEEGKHIKLSVIDSGIGMDEETKNHAFEPFFTTKEVGKGTGMGLAAVYGTVKNHKGCVCVESTLGEGSCFSICLPLCESQESDETTNSPAEDSTPSLRIMVIDDEDLFRNIVVDFLEYSGHSVLTFAEGATAVGYYKHHWQDIDIIILDMIMPGLSGKATFLRLQEVNPDVLVIVASGYSVDGEAREVLKLGAHSFLQKPFGKDQLDDVLRQVSQFIRR